MKPLAGISLDLDNLWSYMKTHGDKGWEDYPSYFDVLVPIVLDFLEQLNLKITFFIVGKDAALEKNAPYIKMLTDSGHEIGNHSFNHNPWLHEHPKEQIEKEIEDTAFYLQQVTGQKPISFRGPGFVYSSVLLEVLAEKKYLFDATILPTYIGPLARAYYFWKSNLSAREKNQRKKIYSSLGEGLKPVKPYFWALPSGKNLLEIPVTTIPILKTPFHLSYLLYLSTYSTLLMSVYLKFAMSLCRFTRTSPSFLLHPLDFISNEEVPELSFFPGMGISSPIKRELSSRVLKQMAKYFKLCNMTEYAKETLSSNRIKVLAA
jgi:hypothetical protein